MWSRHFSSCLATALSLIAVMPLKGQTTSPIQAPVGAVVMFGGTKSNLPDGWIVCDGRALARSRYAKLFRVIGISFGSGDGSTTFNLPDLRGMFVRGVDDGADVDHEAPLRTASHNGGNTGDAVGSRQMNSTRLPNNPFIADSAGAHTHGGYIGTVNLGSHDDGDKNPDPDGREAMPVAGNHVHKIVGGDFETRPVNIAMYYIIRVR